MKSIISKTESWDPPQMSLDQMLAASESEEDAMAAAAVFMGEKLGAAMVLIDGKCGNMARLVSKFRPNVPIVAVVESARIARQLSIHRGVYPTTLPVGDAMGAAIKMSMCQPGDGVVKVQVDSSKGIMSMSMIKA